MIKIAMICTGTELLKGSTVNTNLAFLGGELTAAGLPPVLEIAVGDDGGDLSGALASALRCADAVVISGGLGPTVDDITLDVAARFFGLELVESPELSLRLEEWWRRGHRGRCPRMQYRQARCPAGARIIPNPEGSAVGYDFETVYGGRSRRIFLLPGPPREFEPMARDYLLPCLAGLNPEDRIFTTGFLAAGIGESAASAAVEPAVREFAVTVAYTAKPEGAVVYLSGSDAATVTAAVAAARRAVGKAALPAGVTGVIPELIARLRAEGATLSTAESCTGGLIAAALTDRPGVSEVYLGGAVTYSNALKTALLGVAPELLREFGAVSSETAAAMAAGAVSRFGSTAAVAVTGIAGPGGGSAAKPVGLVYVAAVWRDRNAVKELRLRGSRRAIRERARAQALLLLLELMNAPAGVDEV